MNAYKLQRSIQNESLFSKTISQHKGSELRTKKLATAILIQAFRDIFNAEKSKASQEAKEWRQDATKWFLSKTLKPGSLRWVCAVLGLDDEVLRDWYQTYRESDQPTRDRMAKSLRKMQIPT